MSRWHLATLGDVAERIDYGHTASAVTEPVGPKFLRITDIQNGAVNWASVPHCVCSEADESASRLSPGDIVFARTGATTGKSFLIRDCPERAVFASYLIRVRGGREIDDRYLAHFFQTPQYWSQIAKSARGAAQAGVNASSLKQLKLPLPPLAEQRRIAAILDAADALRQKRRQALRLLDQLSQAIFIEMFGDARLNPMGWPRQPCAELCSRVTVGIVVKPASYYRESGVPAIRGTNIKPSGIDLSDVVYVSADDNNSRLAKTKLMAGDIVLVRSGRPGLAAVVPESLDGANAVDILIATPIRSKIAPRFLRDLINSPSGRAIVLSESKGQVQQHFNVGSLDAAELIVPPIERQHEYEERLDAMEAVRRKAERSLDLCDGIFASLQHRAFRGEL